MVFSAAVCLGSHVVMAYTVMAHKRRVNIFFVETLRARAPALASAMRARSAHTQADAPAAAAGARRAGRAEDGAAADGEPAAAVPLAGGP